MTGRQVISAEPPAEIQDRSQSADRLQPLGYRSMRRKPEGGPKELTPRHQLLIEYQVHGCPHSFVRKMTRPVQELDKATGKIVTVQRPIEPGEQLTLIEAADLLRIRRRNARELAGFPIYQRAYAIEVQRLRDGEKARSVGTMIQIRDDHGQGKAADKTVRLKAAQAILGEGDGNRSTTVNVGVNVGVTAGYVIDLTPQPKDAPTLPLKASRQRASDDAET
ncbi:MAG: hypothetical protein QOF32_1076 [Gammaproteobacteria bacterium]|jgi:hypothetical protein|nr:hypothetical protein [Gammaproteobacteria bacterium]